MLTRQEAFDRALSSLRQQGQHSGADGGFCRYRGDDGCKCAVGHLIPDDKYKASFEGKGANYVSILEAIDAPAADAGFYRELQRELHDKWSGCASSAFHTILENRASDFAADYYLTYTPETAA